MTPARDPASSRLKPSVSLKNAARSFPVRRSLLAFVGKRQTVVRDQHLPQKTPGSRLLFSRIGVLHSPGPSIIELPSTLAYSRCALSLQSAASHYQAFRDNSAPRLPRVPTPPWTKEIKLELGKGAPSEHHPQPTKPPPHLNRPAELRRQSFGSIS